MRTHKRANLRDFCLLFVFWFFFLIVLLLLNCLSSFSFIYVGLWEEEGKKEGKKVFFLLRTKKKAERALFVYFILGVFL